MSSNGYNSCADWLLRSRLFNRRGAGMGEVYLARDPEINCDVAIKVLPAAFIESVRANSCVLHIRPIRKAAFLSADCDSYGNS